MLDFDEVREVLTQQHESNEVVENLYLNGAIPAHVYVQGRLGTFVHLYMGRSRGDAGQLLVRLIRHGSRPRSFDFGSWRDWQIHLDVSGLLEASRAGLLDELERHPNPIRVSPNLPILLVEMQETIRTAQPSVMDAKHRLLNGLQGRLICERDAPPAGGITIGLTDKDGQRDLASLVGGLRAAGYLSPAVAEKRLNALGGGTPAEDLILGAGMALHFDGHALERVAVAGLLETLTGNFAVSVQTGFTEQATRALAAEKEERRLADALGALRERLSHGIQSSRYQLLEARQGDEGGDKNLLVRHSRSRAGGGPRRV